MLSPAPLGAGAPWVRDSAAKDRGLQVRPARRTLSVHPIPRSRALNTGSVSNQVGALADAAAAALMPVLGPVVVVAGERLPSSDRAVVLRAVATDQAGRDHRLVLKAPVGSGPASVREEAALRIAAEVQAPGVVQLLAAGTDPLLLVLTDAGNGPTLADRLLADDPVAAEAALLKWAARLGGLQAATTGAREDFASRLAALSPLGAAPVDTSRDAVAEACAVLARDLPRLGVPLAAGVLEELRELPEALDVTAPGSPGALVPGDTCPSNAIDGDDGLVLLDFEGAEYRHLAWEASYLTVPWPSCWCSWRLPDAVAGQALAAWTRSVAPTHPAVTAHRSRTTLSGPPSAGSSSRSAGSSPAHWTAILRRLTPPDGT